LTPERGEARYRGLPLSFGTTPASRPRGPAQSGGGASREGVLVGVIVAVALAVRLLGVARGLPYIHEWDEPFVLALVIKMLIFHTLNPGVFVYPSLYLYLLLPVVYAHTLYLHAAGAPASIKDVVLAHPLIPSGYVWYINAPSFYLWARAFTALLSAATVYLVYRLGRAAFGPAVGVLAAALLAVAPGAVYYADTVRVDAPEAFFTTAALLVGLGVLARGGRRDYVVAGLLAGLAISTKQTAVWLVPPLMLAHVFNERRTALVDARLGFMLVSMAAGVLLGTPYILIRPDLVLAGQSQGMHAYGLLTSAGWGDVLHRLALNLEYLLWPTQGGDWYVVPHAGLGLLPGIAAAVGLVLGFRRRPRVQGFLVGFPLLLLFFLARTDVFYLRNLAPVLPLAAVWAAAGAVWVWESLPLPRGSWRAAGAMAGIVILLIGPAWESAALASWLNRHRDTRTEAVRWLLTHAPRGAGVALDLDLAWFLPDVERLPFHVEWTDRETALAWYVKVRIDYAVVGEWNPVTACPTIKLFPRPSYLPTVAQEAAFVPNSYPVIDPTVVIVRPRAQCPRSAPANGRPAGAPVTFPARVLQP